MKIKQIHCLNCDTILESDYDKKDYEDYVECNCENKTSLMNYFTFSQPGSIVRAIDKTKVKALAQDDFPFAKKGEWFYLITPEGEDEPKYTKWRGNTEAGGFTGGMSVNFETEPMTFNECRTYLKTNTIMHPEGRIFHLGGNIK